MKFSSYLRRHRRGDDTPYVLGGAAWAIAFFIFALFALSALDSYLLRSGSLAAVISSVLADLANGDRAVNELGTLAVNPVLVAVAQAKANDMAAKGYFAHTSPEGRDPWYWFAEGGYRFSHAGENLAVDFSDSVAVEEAWMSSPGHRANLLDGRFTEVGIAIARGSYEGRETTFVVEVFGTPAVEAREPMALAPTTAGLNPTPSAPPAPPRLAEPSVAGAEASSRPVVPPAPWWGQALASPRTALGYAYYALAAAVFVLLAYMTELEWHRRHLRHAVEASTLLALMAALFILADIFFFSRPVLAASLGAGA